MLDLAEIRELRAWLRLQVMASGAQLLILVVLFGMAALIKSGQLG